MDRTRLAAACENLPIFPLPGTVLMPGSLLPLHVFEPRYRQLVSDCLRDQRPLSVPQLRPGEDEEGDRIAVYPYAAVGLIGAHQELPDGRYNVLVQPLGRVRILEDRATPLPYRIARAELLVDDSVGKAELMGAGDRIRAVFAPLIGRMGQVGEGIARALRSLPADRVSEAVASVVLRSDESRQGFLAENNPLRRADMVEIAVLTLLAEVSMAEAAEA